jgi:SulP family sulfate permease
VFETRLPEVTETTRNSVVIIRLRGRTDLGSTLTETLSRYAAALAVANSKLVLVSDSQRVRTQLNVTGVSAAIGTENLYQSDQWVGTTIRRAHQDAVNWITEHTTT